jgi:hypothetical protein
MTSKNLFPDADLVQFAYDGSLAVDIGDLMYHDTNDAKPASSQADQSSKAANQALFAPLFAGVSQEKKVATDVAGEITVAADWVGEMSCVSSTFEVGDYVTVTEIGAGTALEDQKLEKTTDATLAIGQVIKRYGSATTSVWVHLWSRVLTKPYLY